VHRIKVDEKAGYILTTKSDGGLIVTDLEEDVVLWSLSPVHVTSLSLNVLIMQADRNMSAPLLIANTEKGSSYSIAVTEAKKSGDVLPTTTQKNHPTRL
jgi:hypothetical protein